MTLTLDETKKYLRLDTDDEDALLETLMNSAEKMCADIIRVSVDNLAYLMDDNIRTAMLYATAYLFEHREEADHHALMLNLRAMLFGVRQEGF